MSYFLDVNDEWNQINPKDIWAYNKLSLGRRLGYNCGPIGTAVPKPDFYIVRPCMNLLGMGRFARKEWIDKETDHFYPADFWCEIFHGPHLSVDFYEKKSTLVVLGEKNPDDPLYKWTKWTKIDVEVDFPPILNELVGNYEWINCEFIGNRIIEVQFRQNPDFRYQNTVAIPVWDNKKEKNKDNYQFISDDEYNTYLRKGFYVK
jgi:hypothetical protein